MKYRILEKRRRIFRTQFIPQCKTFLFWHNITEENNFVNSIFNKNNAFTEDSPYVDSLPEAKAVLVNFIKYNISNLEVNIIHKIKFN